MKNVKRLILMGMGLGFLLITPMAMAVENKTVTLKPNTVVATYGKKDITLQDLLIFYRMNPQLQRIPFNKAYGVLLQQYLVNLLISTEANKHYSSLAKEKKSIISQTLKMYRMNLVNDLYLTDKFSKGVNITDAQVKEVYDNGYNNGGFRTPKQAKIEDIVVKTKSQANRVRRQMRKGKKVADLIKKKPYSTYLVKNNNGENLSMAPEGLARIDMLQQDLSAAANKMKVGQVSKVIKIPQGYVVFKVDQILAKKRIPFKDVKAAIKAQLIQQAIAQKSVKYAQTELKNAIQPEKGKPTITIKVGTVDQSK